WEENTYQFNLDELVAVLPTPKAYDVLSEDKDFIYKPFSLFPSALRDIAVWVPEEFSSEDVRAMIIKEGGELLVQSGLFDEYKKDARVSYGFKLVFQSEEKTLADDEVAVVMRKITEALNSQDGFEVR
ncbi:MAG: hypothetical protein WD153_00060, partial [Candidatus Paceibacterota bacterium]